MIEPALAISLGSLAISLGLGRGRLQLQPSRTVRGTVGMAVADSNANL